jgi:hypothetical protein
LRQPIETTSFIIHNLGSKTRLCSMWILATNHLRIHVSTAPRLGRPSAHRTAHHRILFAHLNRLEASCLIQGARPAKVVRVARFGFVVGISFDPRGTADGSIRNHAIEQCRGDPMPSVRRGYDEARDADHRAGSATMSSCCCVRCEQPSKAKSSTAISCELRALLSVVQVIGWLPSCP